MRDPFSFTIKLRSDRCRITMSGKVSDLPIRSKSALFRQKKLERINFKSGKRGRVLRNPPGVTTGQWVSRVVGNVHDHMILCHMVLTRDPVMTIFGELLMCVQVVVTFMHVQQVSVLPPGIDVRKLQHSHSELSRVEPLSGLPSRLFFGLPIRLIRFSVFTQTLSDLTLDWSKVRSDKLLCVHMALVNYLPSIYSARYTQRIIQTVKVTGGG